MYGLLFENERLVDYIDFGAKNNTFVNLDFQKVHFHSNVI